MWHGVGINYVILFCTFYWAPTWSTSISASRLISKSLPSWSRPSGEKCNVNKQQENTCLSTNGVICDNESEKNARKGRGVCGDTQRGNSMCRFTEVQKRLAWGKVLRSWVQASMLEPGGENGRRKMRRERPAKATSCRALQEVAGFGFWISVQRPL